MVAAVDVRQIDPEVSARDQKVTGVGPGRTDTLTQGSQGDTTFRIVGTFLVAVFLVVHAF